MYDLFLEEIIKTEVFLSIKGQSNNMRSYLGYKLMIIFYTMWMCQHFKILTLRWTRAIKSKHKSLARVINPQTLK